MTARLIRITVTFAVVLAAYWLYAESAVPLIEPSRPAGAGSRHVDEDPHQADSRPGRYQDLFASYRDLLTPYFPADHWALDTPRILKSPQGMLLYHEWLVGENQQVELKPCVMIFFPEARAGDARASDGAVILQAPLGAVLQFDEEFDLERGKIGKLEAGVLVGPVTITSGMDANDPNDDLLAETDNVQINARRIWTASRVQFRLGPNRGQGSDMEIRLRDISGPNQRDAARPRIGAIESFKLAYDVEMDLELGDADLPAGVRPVERRAPGDPLSRLPGSKESSTLKITCQGPFHFDAASRLATFEKSVDVLRINREGPSDTLSCELLSIWFKEKTDPKHSGADAPAGPLAALAPYLFEAQGNPVIAHSPSTGSFVRAPLLSYELGPAGQLGTLRAAGPGIMSVAAGDDPSERIECRWGDKLILRPDGEQHVLSLIGRPEVKRAGADSLAADVIHVWLAPTDEDAIPGPSGKRPPRYLPDRMMAVGQVRIETSAVSTLAGEAFDSLKVWFEHALDQSASGAGRAAGSSRLPIAAGKASTRNYVVAGRELRAKLIVRGRDVEATDLSIDGDVLFREATIAASDDEPLEVSGDRLVVTKADTPATEITVFGAPAHVEARGISVDGDNIHLNRGTNQLWIDGPGRMSMPIPSNLAPGALATGSPRAVRPPTAPPVVAAPQILTVEWQQRMVFDGRTILFDRSVVAQTADQVLTTEQLAVTLTETIRFDDATKTDRQSPPIDVELIVCRGGVRIDGRGTDSQGRPFQNAIWAQNLSVDHITGAIQAEGPGWIESVRLGGASPLARRPIGPGVAAAGEQPAREPRLEYLRVNFEQRADGNLHHREMTFHAAKATYGPVDHWNDRVDADSPAGLGAEGMMLTSATLTMSQGPAAAGGDHPIELVAEGSAKAEGRQFSAQAQRMTYDEAKDLIVLEGTGRIDAELWRQVQVGSPYSHATARRILFWPTRNKVQVDGSRYIDLSHIGTGNSP